MRFMIIVALLAVLSFSPAAFADYTKSNPPWTSTMPAQWFSCTIDNDCVLVESPCGMGFSVNIASQQAAHKANCAATDCSGSCDAAKKSADYVVCESGKCVAKFISN
jgi:hypothetical protein